MRLAFPSELSEQPTNASVITEVDGEPITIASLEFSPEGHLLRVAFGNVLRAYVHEAASRLDAYLDQLENSPRFIGLVGLDAYTHRMRALRSEFRRYGTPIDEASLIRLLVRRDLSVLEGVAFATPQEALAKIDTMLRDFLPSWSDHQIVAEDGNEICVRWQLGDDRDRQFTAWRTTSLPGRIVYPESHPKFTKQDTFQLQDDRVYGTNGTVLGVDVPWQESAITMSSLLHPEMPYRAETTGVELRLSTIHLRTLEGSRLVKQLLQSLLGIGSSYVAITASLRDADPGYGDALRQLEAAIPTVKFRDGEHLADGVAAATCLALITEGNTANAVVPSWVPNNWDRALYALLPASVA